jgi:hypothetical protein
VARPHADVSASAAGFLRRVSAVRGGDVIATLALADPGELGPGQSWTDTVEAALPAPVLGSVTWQVSASGAGPTVTATESTRNVPVLLVVLLVVFVVDLLVLAWRAVRRARRRRRRDVTGPAIGDTAIDDAASGGEDDRELAGASA